MLGGVLRNSRLFFLLMIRRPPRSTQSGASAASDVYKRQVGIDERASASRPYSHGLAVAGLLQSVGPLSLIHIS